MSASYDGYISDRNVASAIPAERMAFIRQTYMHLAGAILALIGLESLIVGVEPVRNALISMFTGSTFAMVVLLVLFVGSGYLARYWARADSPRIMQYAGLGLYVVVEAIILAPLLIYADIAFPGKGLIAQAGLLTGAVCGGLTMAVFITGKDFSFLGGALCIAGWLALAVVLGAWMFGFSLGAWFSLAMIGLAAAYVLYDTSNILLHYRTDQYVAASLELFASIATMFYYVLRFLIQMQNRN